MISTPYCQGTHFDDGKLNKIHTKTQLANGAGPVGQLVERSRV